MGAKAPFFFACRNHTLDGVMGVNGIFCIMMLLGLLYAAATGRADAAQRALLSGGGEAVALLLNLAGAYAFFGGLLGVLRAMRWRGRWRNRFRACFVLRRGRRKR